MAVPELDFPRIWRGKTAYELVSAKALADLIRDYAQDLNLDSHSDDHTLHMTLGELCKSNPVPSEAEHIINIFAFRVASLLTTLKRGHTVNRAARPEWDGDIWQAWNKVEHVVLGGGLMEGHFGLMLHEAIIHILTAHYQHDLYIHRASYPRMLPLLGLARQLPEVARRGVVFDFGGSWIKHAVVEMDDSGQIVMVTWGNPVGVDFGSVKTFAETTTFYAQQVLRGMIEVVFKVWERTQPDSLVIPISMAAYVENGNPLPAQKGIYMQTNRITDHLESTLSQHLASRCEANLEVQLWHDGTAAAQTYAGQSNAAVIMLGTALGFGFVDPNANLKQFSEYCVIH